jgi:serine/threonine-protein kinase
MGIVLWELIAGRRLFVGKDEGALVGQVLAGVQTAPSAHVADVPPELDAVVMKALSPQPERRFETAQAMADALTRAVAPAYPPEVGAWVERVAGAAITARDAVLLEIESGVRSGPDESTRVTGETLETVVSSPSSISVETPMTPGRVSRRAKLAVALGVVVLAAAGVGVLSWQRSAPRAGALSSAAAVSTATALAAAPSASESSTTPAPAPASSSASPAPLQVLPAPSTTVRSRPSPRAPTHGRPPPLATHQTTVDPLAP